MSDGDDPFGTLENTQEFLSLLSEKIQQVLDEARRELSACAGHRQAQQVQAWQIVLYTTMKLSSHIANSRRLMSDLDRLREFLWANNA